MSGDIVIGIDSSMNSTGICIDNGNGTHDYYLLATTLSKKKEKIIEQAEGLTLVKIRKDTQPKGEKSKRKSVLQQVNTTANIAYITDAIEDIIKCHNPDYVVIEAPAFRAMGRVADLAGLNHAIRLVCYRADIPCYPISPTTVKKHTVGSGWATKDIMVETWSKLEPRAKEWIDMGIKVDDLADAWALASFDLSIVDIEPGE